MKDKLCVWKEIVEMFGCFYWATSCGKVWSFNMGTPKENDMKYCCFCGKKIKQVVRKK